MFPTENEFSFQASLNHFQKPFLCYTIRKLTLDSRKHKLQQSYSSKYHTITQESVSPGDSGASHGVVPSDRSQASSCSEAVPPAVHQEVCMLWKICRYLDILCGKWIIKFLGQGGNRLIFHMCLEAINWVLKSTVNILLEYNVGSDRFCTCGWTEQRF